MGWKFKFRPEDMTIVLDQFIAKHGEETTLKKLKEEVSKYPNQPMFMVWKNIMGKSKFKWY